MNATALGNDKNSASTNSNPHNLQGGSRWFSQNVFQEGPKMVKFGFYPSKLKKQTFLLIISQSRGSKVSLSPLATPMANMKDDVMPSSPITKSSFFSLWTSQRCRSFTAWRQLTKVSVNLWDIIHYCHYRQSVHLRKTYFQDFYLLQFVFWFVFIAVLRFFAFSALLWSSIF